MSGQCGPEHEAEGCMCRGGSLNLDILKDVQRAYEERLDAVERYGGPRRLQMQVDVMKSWVDDLVGQNSLLVQAIEELETEATAKLLHERTKYSEIEGELRAELSALRRRLARKDSDLRGLVEVLRRLREFDYCTLEGIHFFEVTESDIFGSVQWRQTKLEQGDTKGDDSKTKQSSGKGKTRRRYKLDKKSKKFKELMSMNDTLQKENLAKEREIRRLNKDMHQFEQKVLDLRREISSTKCFPPRDKRDVEVSAGICCSDRVENGSGESRYSAALQQEANKCQEVMRTLETKLKSADENVFALRKVNVALSEELHALRRVCAALDEQCRACTQRAQFKDEIIREMRRQLKQAKTKLKESEANVKSQGDTDFKSTNVSCQAMASSTPVPASRACSANSEPDVSIIERDPSVQNISSESIEDLERLLFRDCCLTPSSMVACARQARINSTSTGPQNIIPTIGLAMANNTNSHSPDKTRQTEISSSCDCANYAHAKAGNASDEKSQAEPLSATAPPGIDSKYDREAESSGSKSPRKSSKRPSFLGLFHKNKSTKTSGSSEDTEALAQTPKKTKIKKEKLRKSPKSSESDDFDKEAKISKRKIKKPKLLPPDELDKPPKWDTKPASTSTEDFGMCRCESRSTEILSKKESLVEKKSSHNFLGREKQHSNRFLPAKKPRTKHFPPEQTPEQSKSSKHSKQQQNKTSNDSQSSDDYESSSKKSKKLKSKKKKKEKRKKSESNSTSDSSSDSGESGLIDAGTGTAVVTPADVGDGTSTLNSEPLQYGKILPISSCPNSPDGSPRPELCVRKSYPCSPRPCPSAAKPYLAKILPPCSLKPCPSQKNPCGSKLSSLLPPPGAISSPCALNPCTAKSLPKPCSRSQNSSPCRSPNFSIVSSLDKALLELSNLIPCPGSILPLCGPQSCPTESPPRPWSSSRTSSPCRSPRLLEESTPAKTCPKGSCVPKYSSFMPCPGNASTPCAPKPCSVKSLQKPCSRSQNSSPRRSPRLSVDSSLNKTFPCAPRPCPDLSSPCTKNLYPSALPPCIARTCPGESSCIHKAVKTSSCAPKPCRPPPCNEISPCHSPLSSADSSCIDICSLTKDQEQESSPCDNNTFSPLDFLKRCVQFLPYNENLKPLCPTSVCSKAGEVCPTIKEEQTDGTICNQSNDKCMLTQDESCDLAGMCDAARAQYYRNKLISTQQILENKEETVRIQGESLAIAESRLTTLTIRAKQLRQELECKSRELRMLRRAMSGSCGKQTPRTDACTACGPPACADLQKHKNTVKTLQTNLSVIEELYRECFYETAKQEALIEKLRQSYLDVRLSDKEKTDEIDRLQSVVNTHKWSLDQCQDIALEVEGLKMEISNFLNSSNNDSGMWERGGSEDSAATEVGEDLQQIMDQLLHLRDLLQEDPAITELTNENCRLKCENERLEIEIGDNRQKLCELESTVQNNEEVIKQLEDEKEGADQQLRCAQHQVEELTEQVRELECAQRGAQDKFSEMESLQNMLSAKLEAAAGQLSQHGVIEAQLRADLEEAKQLAEENARICGELSALQETVRAWGAQLQESQARVCALHAELQRARARADRADRSYRQQVEMTTELQQQLEEAHARGAALCDESRRVVCAVRQWVRDNCAQRREQEETIKRQKNIIWTLNKELEEKQCCCAPSPVGASRTVGCTKCGRERDRDRGREEHPRCGLATCPAIHVQSETGVCEVEASCSSGPVPPKRLSKKKGCTERCAGRCRSASAQQPAGTRDAGTAPPSPAAPAARCCQTHNVRHLRLAGCIGPSVSPTRPRGQSPSQELLQRVENLHDALVTGQRRWGHQRPSPDDSR